MADQANTPSAEPKNRGTEPEKEKGLIARSLQMLFGQRFDLGAIGVLAIAIVFLYFLIYGVLGKRQILDRLSSAEYARGLITYILAVGTMAIAMVVAVGGLLSRGEGTTADQEAEKRFGRGKEILTILVGVLGTIVGFYYGSQAGEGGGGEALTVSTPLISNATPVAGEKISLTSFVHGGVPPYKYEISFKDAPKDAPWKEKKGKANEAGWAVEEFELTNAKPEKLAYTIKVTDAKGASSSYTSDETTSIEVKAKQTGESAAKPAGADGNMPITKGKPI